MDDSYAATPLDGTEAFQLSTRVVAGRFATQDENKLRGGYYTPGPLANWLAKWAIRRATDRVLEPSCGDGTFAAAAVGQLLSLGATKGDVGRQFTAIEIVPNEAEKAREQLRALLGQAGDQVIWTADFFACAGDTATSDFDAVVGNPPFIRYQAFPEPSRSRAMNLLISAGLKPNKLTNIWVPFVVGACLRLRGGGRLALVLPAELLQVTYAAQLRSFLIDRFERIDIIACNELFFEGAEQEVVLLLADSYRATNPTADCRVALTEAQTVKAVTTSGPFEFVSASEAKKVEHSSEKWLKYFLSAREIEFMREVRKSEHFAPLSMHGSVDVGVVTGKNEIFVVDHQQVSDWGLAEFVVPLIGRAAHLKGARIDEIEWRDLASRGDRVFLLDLAPSVPKRLPTKVRAYITAAELEGLHTGFKCANRSPWYAVPSVWVPEGFFFRQIYDFPRAVENNASATSTDTIHRLRAKNPERVIANVYTHLAAASAEIEGRSYGGGVLELEPTEAERLLLPAKLDGALPVDEADRLLREGRLNDLLAENDRLVLREIGLGNAECNLLKEIWVRMRDRRNARRRRPSRR